MSANTYVMGVDGGGSKTHAVIVDANGVRRGSGVAGSANHQMTGAEAAAGHIRTAAEAALREAGLGYEDIAFAQYGLAGLDREQDYEIMHPVLDRLPFSRWAMECDTLEGLRTGSPRNVGVVLICGSGTNAAGRDLSGRAVQVGGIGYLYGDSAGANYMATQMFRAAVRSWQGRERPSVLPDKLLRYFDYPDMDSLINDFLDRQIYQIREGRMTVSLHEAADEGDALAISLLQKTGRELGISGKAVIRQLGSFGEGPVPVVLIGSVLQKGRSPYLLEALRKEIQSEQLEVEIIIPDMAPVYGAVLLALDQIHITLTPAITHTFSKYGGYDS